MKHAPSIIDVFDCNGKNLLHLAAELGSSELAKFLVETCKMNINEFEKNEAKNTPLHLACARSMMGSHGIKVGSIIPTLLSLKANKNLKNGRNQTPEELIQVLLESHSFSTAQTTAMTVVMRRLQLHEKESS